MAMKEDPSPGPRHGGDGGQGLGRAIEPIGLARRVPLDPEPAGGAAPEYPVQRPQPPAINEDHVAGQITRAGAQVDKIPVLDKGPHGAAAGAHPQAVTGGEARADEGLLSLSADIPVDRWRIYAHQLKGLRGWVKLAAPSADFLEAR